MPGNQSVHGLNIPAAGGVLNGTHCLKQQGFGYCVEDQQQNSGPYRLLSAHTGTGGDQSQVGDGRVGQHSLAVADGNGQHGSDQECKAPDQAHHRAGIGAVHHRRQADQQVHTGLYHRGAVQQCRGGRGRHHGSQQPAGERQLCALGQCSKGQQNHRRHHQLAVAQDQALQVCDPKAHPCPKDGCCKSKSAQQIHPQGTEAVLHRLFGAGVADQQEGHKAGDLPKKVEP